MLILSVLALDIYPRCASHRTPLHTFEDNGPGRTLFCRVERVNCRTSEPLACRTILSNAHTLHSFYAASLGRIFRLPRVQPKRVRWHCSGNLCHGILETESAIKGVKYYNSRNGDDREKNEIPKRDSMEKNSTAFSNIPKKFSKPKSCLLTCFCLSL